MADIFLFHSSPDLFWPRRKKIVYYTYRILLLFCAGFCMGLVLLVLAVGPYPKTLVFDYLRHWETLLLNTLPSALLTVLLYGLIGIAWPSFLISGIVFLGLSIGNYYKLQFRSDPVYFADLFNLREATNMAGGGHYTLVISKSILFSVLCLLLGTALLWLLAPGKKRSLPASAAAAVVTACLVPLYVNQGIYDGLENYESLNQWNPSENYIAHGFLYPFLHSAAELIDFPPNGYSAAKAEALLSQYQDADIPADRQINIIAVMREAYADFSRYGLEGLSSDCYTLYHQLEEESYTGDLVTNIFAGGTVDTERCFLTGNYKLKNYRADTNSYLWYLRDQGYTVEGSHPYYQWFYNRQNVNGYLGFERYRFWENDFEHLTDALLPEDAVLYPEVYADFQANKASGKPYFSFVLNVQSHGPYLTENYYGGSPEYLNGNYSAECRNAMNNYLSCIMNSDLELAKFIDWLRTDPEPVVLVTFGDHLPWMGNQNAYYDELGMNIDISTEDGFFTRYSTRYLIWANEAAEALLGHELRGAGPRISPCYLMGLLFRLLDWEGPAYMQALDDLMDVIPVAAETDRFVIDGVLTDVIPEERADTVDSFLFLQYYWRTKWLYQDSVPNG